MAKIQEEIEKDGVQIMVLRPDEDEYAEEGCIIHLDLQMGGVEQMTAKDLRDLGQWLISQGKRIGREYDEKGDKKS